MYGTELQRLTTGNRPSRTTAPRGTAYDGSSAGYNTLLIEATLGGLAVGTRFACDDQGALL